MGCPSWPRTTLPAAACRSPSCVTATRAPEPPGHSAAPSAAVRSSISVVGRATSPRRRRPDQETDGPSSTGRRPAWQRGGCRRSCSCSPASCSPPTRRSLGRRRRASRRTCAGLVQAEVDRAEVAADEVADLRSRGRPADRRAGRQPAPRRHRGGRPHRARGRVGRGRRARHRGAAQRRAARRRASGLGHQRDLVVHQQDVQAVMNALWAGGAEAMSLQDQRVVSTSAFRCVGNVLCLQGRLYSPPYVIRAIGDPDAMIGRARRDPSVQTYLGLRRRRRPRLVGRDRWTTSSSPAYDGAAELPTPRRSQADGDHAVSARGPRAAHRRAHRVRPPGHGHRRAGRAPRSPPACCSGCSWSGSCGGPMSSATGRRTRSSPAWTGRTPLPSCPSAPTARRRRADPTPAGAHRTPAPVDRRAGARARRSPRSYVPAVGRPRRCRSARARPSTTCSTRSGIGHYAGHRDARRDRELRRRRPPDHLRQAVQPDRGARRSATRSWCAPRRPGTSTGSPATEIVAPTADRRHRARARRPGGRADRRDDDDDHVPPDVQRARALRRARRCWTTGCRSTRARPASAGARAGGWGPHEPDRRRGAIVDTGRCGRGRRPEVVTVRSAVAGAARTRLGARRPARGGSPPSLVVVCFGWVFPAIAPLMPFNDVTVE